MHTIYSRRSGIEITIRSLTVAQHGRWVTYSIVSVDQETETVTLMRAGKYKKRLAISFSSFFASYWKHRRPEEPVVEHEMIP